MTLRSGDLQLMVTPLHESVTLVTAPDTYRRLSGLARTYGGPRGGEGLFLVSFYAEELEVAFVPEEVQLVSSGSRARPSEILAITPGWGERRVGQRRTESAVYRFDRPIDLESDVVLAYGLERTTEWDMVLPRIRAERARARARAGG
jgi:hypothetical protein